MIILSEYLFTIDWTDATSLHHNTMYSQAKPLNYAVNVLYGTLKAVRKSTPFISR